MPMPKTSSSAESATSDGASATTMVIAHMSANAARVARRLPVRAASAPASGIATIEPIGMNASAMPSSPSESPSRSRIAGIRAAHEP